MIRVIPQASEGGVQAVLVVVFVGGCRLAAYAGAVAGCGTLVGVGFCSQTSSIAVDLVRANDELAEELAAETVKVVAVELGRLLLLEV